MRKKVVIDIASSLSGGKLSKSSAINSTPNFKSSNAKNIVSNSPTKTTKLTATATTTTTTTIDSFTQHRPQRILPDQALVAKLSHGLERVLFSPGVHWMRCPRTGVYNFDPSLSHMPEVDSFNYEMGVPPFVPASEDKELLGMAKSLGCSYISSTSSISPTLSQLYFLLNQNKSLNLDHLTQSFENDPRSHTLTTRSPTSIILTPHDGGRTASLMVEKVENQFSSPILSQMGQLMEKMLTTSPKEFSQFINNPNAVNAAGDCSGGRPSFNHAPQPYAYCVAGPLLLRSQLDCTDPRLPRQSFDLKTRATFPIRHSMENWRSLSNYRLDQMHGKWNSFEREYYDLARSALLKYSFQVRIGNMDGIFVAYHNVKEIFGFQYCSLEEIDEKIFGNTEMGDATFSLLLQMLERSLLKIRSSFKENNELRITFSLNSRTSMDSLSLFVEDLTENSSLQLKDDDVIAMIKKGTLRQWDLQVKHKFNGRFCQPSDVSFEKENHSNLWLLDLEIGEEKAEKKIEERFRAARASILERGLKKFDNANGLRSGGQQQYNQQHQPTIPTHSQFPEDFNFERDRHLLSDWSLGEF